MRHWSHELLVVADVEDLERLDLRVAQRLGLCGVDCGALVTPEGLGLGTYPTDTTTGQIRSTCDMSTPGSSALPSSRLAMLCPTWLTFWTRSFV
jgi:hypothetical protein